MRKNQVFTAQLSFLPPSHLSPDLRRHKHVELLHRLREEEVHQEEVRNGSDRGHDLEPLAEAVADGRERGHFGLDEGRGKTIFSASF